MTVALQTSNTNSGVGVASITITKPASTVDGDFLIAAIAKRNTAAVTAPSGWSLLKQVTVDGSFTGGIYFKEAASEGASYQWTWTGNTNVIGGIVRIDGQDPDFAFGAENSNWAGNQDIAGTTHSTTNGITPTEPNSLILIFALNMDDNTDGYSTYAIATDNPASWTEQFDVGGTLVRAACGYALRSQGTATGNGSAVYVNSDQRGAIFLLSVSPTPTTFVPKITIL